MCLPSQSKAPMIFALKITGHVGVKYGLCFQWLTSGQCKWHFCNSLFSKWYFPPPGNQHWGLVCFLSRGPGVKTSLKFSSMKTSLPNINPFCKPLKF
jgi:hypothetical protein